MRLTQAQAQIKLDIDPERWANWSSYMPDNVDTIRRRIERAGYQIRETDMRPSPSGKGFHMLFHVTPRPKSAMEVVALQAICGSDPYREAMQMHRARSFPYAAVWMRNGWNVLYQSHPKRQRHVKLKGV